MITRTSPPGAPTQASTAMRGMPFLPGSIGDGSRCRYAWRTGSRDRIMLPNRRRRPPSAGMVDRHAADRRESGQQRRERRELVLARAAGKARMREVVRDLLQAQHVEIGELLRLGDDPRRIDAAVHTAAPLHVPRDQYHRMPARMKLCTNCR